MWHPDKRGVRERGCFVPDPFLFRRANCPVVFVPHNLPVILCDYVPVAEYLPAFLDQRVVILRTHLHFLRWRGHLTIHSSRRLRRGLIQALCVIIAKCPFPVFFVPAVRKSARQKRQQRMANAVVEYFFQPLFHFASPKLSRITRRSTRTQAIKPPAPVRALR